MTRIQLFRCWIFSASLCLLALPTGASAGIVVTEMLFNQRVHFAGGATDSAASIAIVNPFSQTLTAQLESTVAESTYEFQWDELTGTGDYRSTFEHSSNPVHMTTRIFDRVRFDTDAPTRLRVHGFLEYAVTGTTSYFDIDFYIWVDTGDGNVTILWAEVGTDYDENRSGIVEFDQEVLIDANKSAFFHASLGSEAMPTHFSANGEVNVAIRPLPIGGNTCHDDGFSEAASLEVISSPIATPETDPWAAVYEDVCVFGDTIIAGNESGQPAGGNSGAAYLFRHTGGVWGEDRKLIASDAQAGDAFGAAVAIADSTALVGAPRDDDDGENSGSVYVFERINDLWAESAKFRPADGAAANAFGTSIALDGDTAVIGAEKGDGAATDSGTAYVFRRIAGAWQEEAKLTAADAATNDLFGQSVSISGDTIIVGARGNGIGGAAYVFRYDAGAWHQEARLANPFGEAGDSFGISVSIDGELAVIGSPGSMSAHVFRRTGTTWAHETNLSPSAYTPTQFGQSVSISGNLVVVGDASTPAPTGSGLPGAASVYLNDGNDWLEAATLRPAQVIGPVFGYSISIDGGSIVCGGINTVLRRPYVFELTTSGDCNQNLVPDECDIDGVDPDNDGLVSADCNGDGIPDECRTPGDTNGDGMVDLGDVAGFVAEALGQVVCRFGDFNADGTTDGHDVGLFAAALLGS